MYTLRDGVHEQRGLDPIRLVPHTGVRVRVGEKSTTVRVFVGARECTHVHRYKRA